MLTLILNLVFLCHCFSGVNSSNASEVFSLTVAHLNDFHARYEEISTAGGNCKTPNTCIGGIARLYSQITRMRKDNPELIVLNAGDNFQGTLYYNIGKWNITQEYMNKIPWDATVLGNHEFDDGISGVVPYILNMQTPVLAANIDDTLHPEMHGIYNKSVVIERGGKKIGIVGVTWANSKNTNKIENLNFLPESSSTNDEAERLVKEEGVFTVIVLSHCGYEADKLTAQNASEKIGLIVGGHTHTFLYSGEDYPGIDEPKGPYPTIIKSKHNKDVLIVQAAAFGKFVGNITVLYDENGEVKNYSGNPIYLDNSKPKDAAIEAALEPYRAEVEAFNNEIIGSSLVELKMNCNDQECNLGSLIADTMVYAYLDTSENNSWTFASVAFINHAGIRAGIEIGDITYNDAWIALPFSNTIDVGEIEGKYIKMLLEEGLSEDDYANGDYSSLNVLQVSGMKFSPPKFLNVSDSEVFEIIRLQVVYNLTKPKGERAQSIKIRCQVCLIPAYEPLIEDKIYRIVVQQYLRLGGSGFTVLTDNLKNVEIGKTDIEVFMDFFKNKSPAFQDIEGRVVIVK